MQIEQPAELNRHVDPSIPLTWVVRWQGLKPLLPLLVCCSVLFAEQLAFRLWLNDCSLLTALPLLVVIALFPMVLVMIGSEIRLRVQHRTKRVLKLEPKRVMVSPAKCNRIGWQQISAWRLVPLAGAEGLSKLTVEYSLGRKGKPRRQWSMVLRQSDQQPAFLSELEYLRQVGSTVAPVLHCPKPAPVKPQPRVMRPMIALALGFWCFVHGLPLLGVGLLPPTKHRDEPESSSRFTPREKAKLRRVVAEHFSAAGQFRTFALVTGGGLVALGIGCYIWGMSSPRKSDEPTQG